MNCSLRLAFLGDIHGNLPALEAVLNDIDQQAPDAVFLLGDLINRCPWTRDVIDILRQRNWPSVQGNHDLVLAQLNTPDEFACVQQQKPLSQYALDLGATGSRGTQLPSPPPARPPH